MKKLFAVLSVCFFLFACKKEAPVFCTDAAIKWGGEPAADGLGWYILADSVTNKIYIPQNLPNSLKIDGQLVNVCLYKTDENFDCMCAEPLKKYHITSIRKL